MTIRKKLIVIQLVTAFAVLAAGSAVFVANAQRQFRTELVSNVSSTAELIGENTASTLQFLDSESAAQVLSTLRIEPHIANAAIYDESGSIFATYSRMKGESFLFPEVATATHAFDGEYLTLFRPILRSGNQIGTVFMRSDLTQAGDEAFRLFSWRRASTLFERVVISCRQVADTTDAAIHALRRGVQANVYLAAHNKARELGEEMRELARREGRPLDEAEALKLIGKINEHERKFPQAVEVYEEAMACLQGLDVPMARAKILINWGVADFECGRYDQAESSWQEVVDVAGEEGLVERAEALNNLAVIATIRGDLDRAWTLNEQVLATRDSQLEPSPQTCLTYYNMGMLRADQERWDEALELYERSMELCREVRFIFHEPVIELNRTEALIGKGNLVEARTACSAALRGLRRLDDSLGVADALRLYGRLCRLERSWSDGKTYLERSVELNRQFGDSISLAEALFELGLLERDQGEAAAALGVMREAEEIFAKAEARLDLDKVRAAIDELKPVAKSA